MRIDEQRFIGPLLASSQSNREGEVENSRTDAHLYSDRRRICFG